MTRRKPRERPASTAPPSTIDTDLNGEVSSLCLSHTPSRCSWSEVVNASKPSSPISSNIASARSTSPVLLQDQGPPETVVLSWRSLQLVRPMNPRGLVNYSNMCFLNAILQCLIHIPFVSNLFAKLEPNIRRLCQGQAPFTNAL